jgi:hypothetical protein
MITLNKLTLGLAFITLTSFANGTVITSLEDATNGGGFFGEVTFTNNGTNTVTVTADISSSINAGITQGDILGLWFDLGDFSSLSGIPTFGGATNVLNDNFGENSVGSSLGGPIKLNGTGATDWDLAVAVGVNGSSGGFVQTLSFDLIINGIDETQFTAQRVGMRVQSIEGTTNFSSGSSKLLGTNTTQVSEPGSLLLCGMALLGLGLTRNKYLS